MKVIHFTDTGFAKSWDDGVLKIKGTTPIYSSLVREYEREVFSGSMERDDSFAVLSDSNEIAAIVPLYCFTDEAGISDYRYSGEYLRAPLICGSPDTKQYRKTQKFVFDYIEHLAQKNKIRSHKAVIEGVELLEGRHYYNFLTDYGYSDESAVARVIDSSRNAKDLWSDVRKSYKSLINRAAKNFNCETIASDNYDFDKCEDYRKMHFKAAGKQTRSLKSFHLMYNMVKNSQAFILIVREKDGVPAASHFFYYMGVYCFYASSAVDPDQPSNSGAGHLGFWQGILSARSLGCWFVDMGQLWINTNPSEKIKNIALFKKGFGGFPVAAFRGTKVFSG